MPAAMSPQIATNTRVDRAGLLEFARPRHRAILLTSRASGTVQASPVTCGVDREGHVVISTYPERAKAVNIPEITPQHWGPVATGGFPARLAS